MGSLTLLGTRRQAVHLPRQQRGQQRRCTARFATVHLGWQAAFKSNDRFSPMRHGKGSKGCSSFSNRHHGWGICSPGSSSSSNSSNNIFTSTISTSGRFTRPWGQGGIQRLPVIGGAHFPERILFLGVACSTK